MHHKIIDADYWRTRLQLQNHVEGGSFFETYRSSLEVPHTILPRGFAAARSVSTAIYFLLEYGEFSAFHRIASDEIWHHYDGQTLTIYEIPADGTLKRHQLGKDPLNNALPQLVIPAGSWFASVVEIPGGYSLCGCTVSPGFDFSDFELANPHELSALFPLHRDIIRRLTY